MRVLYSVMAIIFILSSFATTAQAAQKKIYINVASRLMTFYDGNIKVAVYHLGLGKVSTPTPTGYYQVRAKEINPPWIDPSDPEYDVPSGPDNPLGYRWMEIQGNYGIHGTNRPDSIGGYVSNGCIRMREQDVEALFDAVEVGTPVEITY
ncbi:MAG: L,D-transpeptidase, partial [Selenomonadaceae bacterium]|nr:L,D-transpeptidase [Selenomonadaceae bacterium]